MNSLETMISLLKPTGLYKLDDSYVFCELKAEAAGLDRLFAALDELLRECFPQTAEEEGLRVYERVMHLGGIPESTAALQNRITGALSLCGRYKTLSAVEAGGRIFGTDWTITENPSEESLSVSGEGFSLPYDAADDIFAMLGSLLPAHLEASFNLHVATWYTWNRLGKTFSELDAENRSFTGWDATANLTGSL